MEVVYECEMCEKKFLNKYSLILHLRTHNDMKNYCLLCQQEFDTTPLLLKHLKVHVLRERLGSEIFQCGICLRNFEQQQQLNVHFENHLNGIRDTRDVRITAGTQILYKCPICSKVHLRSDLCQQHLLRHIMDIKCGLCNKSFSKYEDLVNHTRTHTKEGLLECNQCERAFYKKEHLERHSRMHSGETPFKCNTCLKAFSRKDNLQKHIRTHSIARVRCTICSKEFKSLGLLKIHISRSHTNDLRYKCDQCDKSFFTTGNLLLHKKTHKDVTTIALKIVKLK